MLSFSVPCHICSSCHAIGKTIEWVGGPTFSLFPQIHSKYLSQKFIRFFSASFFLIHSQTQLPTAPFICPFSLLRRDKALLHFQSDCHRRLGPPLTMAPAPFFPLRVNNTAVIVELELESRLGLGNACECERAGIELASTSADCR